MHELAELILDKYDGSLKAEHGTGTNMAPFVEREWGAKATEMMWRVKQLADPDGILSPGVVLNRDARVHLRNLKSTPEIEEVATKCVECGFCEPVCPSRNVTTTPRQRIALRREMARQPAGSPVLEALLEQYEYDAIDTCAADGSCALACPVAIDTGKLVKELRTRHADRARARRWRRAGRALRERASAPAARWRGPGAAAPGAVRAACARWSALPERAAPELAVLPIREGAAAVYLPVVHQPDLRQLARRAGAPVAALRAGGDLPAGRAAAVDPRRRRRQLLRPALELEGVPSAATSTWRATPPPRCAAGSATASCRW